ncbi:MAG TPA: NAD(P)-dependent oxidoreductase [Candidatus Acidoferrum sp.]|nr:NAD(P)-dependent oxidoreductase [Candidatus Acidoferrum sp.]
MTRARRLLITGGGGMLATDLHCVAEARGHAVTAPTRDALDVTVPGDVRAAFEAFAPDAVVQAVGLAVDFCEEQPEEALRVHAWGTACVARECERRGAAFVSLSSCGLFGDDVRFYDEYDAPVLKTQYARSKHEGERAALASCRRAYVVRPGWLFGGTSAHPRNFVARRWDEAHRVPVLRSAGDKFGSPTFTEDLAARILDLLDTDAYGLYHVTNAGGGSRYDYVRHIVDTFGLPNPVEKVDSSHHPRSAPVPACEMLENLNTRFLGLAPLPPWQDAIERHVRQLRATDPAFR